MIEIKRNISNKEKINGRKENRSIEFDKSIPFEILYKPVKITPDEKEVLNLNTNDMNILTLSYTKEDGTKDEFVLGNLNNIDIKDGKTNLHEYINNINKLIQKEYKKINAEKSKLIQNNTITKILDELKNILEKNYKIEYTPESYQMFYGDSRYQNKYEGKKTLEIISDGTYNNLEFYGDTNKKVAFRDNNKNVDENIEESPQFIEKLRENVNLDNDAIIANYQDEQLNSKIRYIDTIDSDEKIAEFFEANKDILAYIIENNPDFKEAYNRFNLGKTNVNDISMARILSRGAFNYLKNVINTANSKLLYKIKLPNKTKENNELGII